MNKNEEKRKRILRIGCLVLAVVMILSTVATVVLSLVL